MKGNKCASELSDTGMVLWKFEESFSTSLSHKF